MKIQSVCDEEFLTYGKVIEGVDFSAMLKTLEDTTKKPKDEVIYVPSAKELEDEDVFDFIKDNLYGGMPIQAGYCNGNNTKLNCLEYHRDSEINIVNDDMIFLVAKQQDIVKGCLNTDNVEAFLAKKGMAVELYATTLHYAPCNAKKDEGFRVIVILPKNTNTQKPEVTVKTFEDKLLWARNKWLIAHKDTDEAKEGAFVGLIGKNIDIKENI